MVSSATIAELRESLRAIQGDGLKRRPVLPFGVAALDGRIASGGLRLDSLHEVAAASPDPSDDAAATLFMAGAAARAWGPVLWVVRRRDLFAPGLYQAGLDPERVLYAEAADDAEVLALMEEGLRHRGLGAVIGEVKRAAMPNTRRLQLAAEGGKTIALLLKRHAREGGNPLHVPSAAITRWRIGSAPSEPLPVEGVGRACWRVALVRQRGGEPFETIMEACDETGRLALPARLADRTAAADGADRYSYVEAA
ncbi:protein ImuA [Sphingomonas panacis]|uniref:Protein ImuA n=1 Tax=Sphingomonas panacis TaxID=1560345 RepID=A0A1B3Z6L5_9SPHN|nr:protein ImuA [Sphingomonas panacis]AOH83070.1 protein ImuA [Sphingomonas panacis]